jgi:hypothetical protein
VQRIDSNGAALAGTEPWRGRLPVELAVSAMFNSMLHGDTKLRA